MELNASDKFMWRCLDLAVKAEGQTRPNPMVGAVVVHNGRIIGEGYHLKAGSPHAEVNAINSVTDKSLLKNSTIFVNLEPCSHFGKTPPCTDLIIASQIPIVVAGTVDTSEKVAGSGLEILKKAGCQVVTGVLEPECRYLNRRFFTFHEKKRPFVTLKWARSADGYIDITRDVKSTPGPHWITGNNERILVHKWRSQEEAILVGAGTIRRDNPKLNVRDWTGIDPVKLILSRSGDTGNYLTGNETNGTVIVFTENIDKEIRGGEKVQLEKDVSPVAQILDFLYKKGIQSLFVEGGAAVLNLFLDSGLWDEARIFTGKKYFMEGLKGPVISGLIISEQKFETSSLEVRINII